MKMKFGAIVTDGRGKIGGHVASKNRGGAYLRTKVTPANGKTVAQNAVRAIFTTLAQAWRGLTEGQRQAWNAAVTNFSRTNIFGDLINPSGINLFQRLNNNLLSISEGMISEPPLPSEVGACVIQGISVVTSDDPFELTLSNAVPAGTNVKVFATAPMSAGKSFVKSEYRQICVLSPKPAVIVDIIDAYLEKFGSTGSAGQKIFVKILPINTTTGQAGAESSTYGIVGIVS
jgi:hypothetical protein